MGLRVPVGMQAQASLGMSGVESGKAGGGGGVLVKVYQETERVGEGGVTTQMRRACADTVKLSHFVGSASLILMFRMGRVIWERNYFHL